MVTLKQPCKPSGRLCGPKAPPWEDILALRSSETADDGTLIITGSFNGLLDRVAKIDYWEVSIAGMNIVKKAKKEGIEAAIRMSEVSKLKGLKAVDLELFSSSLGIIKILETSEDPLLSAPDVFGVLKVFERFVDQRIISLGK